MRHSPLDMWQGRRQKPLINGKATEAKSFNEQLIHEDRMRRIETPPNHGPDPKPQRPEKHRETTFQPLKLEEPPSPPVASVLAENKPSEAGAAPKCGGSLKHHERPNHIEAEARKAEAAAMSQKEKAERKRRTPKVKLTPGKERHVRGKT